MRIFSVSAALLKRGTKRARCATSKRRCSRDHGRRNGRCLIDLYIAYFNRVLEASGLLYWIDQHKGGMSLSDIAGEFYRAGIQYSDITGYSASMRIADFIGILYKNVLGRTGQSAPAQAEIDYWLNEVATAAVTREGMVQRFLTDARSFYDHPQVGFVPLLLDNKVALGKLHAVTYGIDCLSEQQAISMTARAAHLVTPTSFDTAANYIGVAEGE